MAKKTDRNTNSAHRLAQICRRHAVLIALLVFLLLVRLPWLVDLSIPFTFDHGKDSLAILSIWLTLSPKLIGPWTSIPGLFFGPAWYYLLLPSYVILQGHPVAPVLMMILLVMVQVIIAYKFFGKWEALLVATSQAWMTMSLSAWNPFPMALLSWVVLAVLKKVEETRILTIKQVAVLSLSISLGFHFSTAFAIFYVPIVLLSLWVKGALWSYRKVAVGFAGLLVGFVPQLIFEVRNQFLQTRAIIQYLQTGEKTDPASLDKLWSMLQIGWGEIKLAVLPDLYLSDLANGMALFTTFTIICLGALALHKKSKSFYLLTDMIIWTVIPIIGFLFLHFNYWYLLGLLPLWVMMVSQLLRRVPKTFQVIVVILFVLTPLSKVGFYYRADRVALAESRAMLPAKLKAIEFIRSQANGEPFASYQYVPDIYDFSYQYLYFWQALQGQSLPAEFSYKPGAQPYITDKQRLLEYFNHTGSSKPQKIFYIVESPVESEFLKSWWDQQKYGEIVRTTEITTEITVYEATP